MQNTHVPFFFDYTSYPLHVETTSATTENHLIPVDLSMDDAHIPLPVNLSVLPHYAQLPDYDSDPDYLDPVTIQPVQEGISVSDTLFLRFCSAIEGVTLFIIIREILPDLWSKRTLSGFYCRLLFLYILIFVFITIRFYDFLEANIFRTMSDNTKIRFLLYFVGPLVGVPLVYLLIMIIIWESSFSIKSLISGGIVEGTLSTLGILLFLCGIYMYVRRRLHILSNQQVFKTKLVLCILSVNMMGACMFLILMLSQAEIVMDDLVDSIVKLLICGSYVGLIKYVWFFNNVFPSLVPSTQGDSTTIVHDTLREEQNCETV